MKAQRNNTLRGSKQLSELRSSQASNHFRFKSVLDCNKECASLEFSSFVAEQVMKQVGDKIIDIELEGVGPKYASAVGIKTLQNQLGLNQSGADERADEAHLKRRVLEEDLVEPGIALKDTRHPKNVRTKDPKQFEMLVARDPESIVTRYKRRTKPDSRRKSSIRKSVSKGRVSGSPSNRRSTMAKKSSIIVKRQKNDTINITNDALSNNNQSEESSSDQSEAERERIREEREMENEVTRMRRRVIHQEHMRKVQEEEKRAHLKRQQSLMLKMKELEATNVTDLNVTFDDHGRKLDIKKVNIEKISRKDKTYQKIDYASPDKVLVEKSRLFSKLQQESKKRVHPHHDLTTGTQQVYLSRRNSREDITTHVSAVNTKQVFKKIQSLHRKAQETDDDFNEPEENFTDELDSQEGGGLKSMEDLRRKRVLHEDEVNIRLLPSSVQKVVPTYGVRYKQLSRHPAASSLSSLEEDENEEGRGKQISIQKENVDQPPQVELYSIVKRKSSTKKVPPREIFKQVMEKFTPEHIKEMEAYAEGTDGFESGGMYEHNPKLSLNRKLSISKYVQMRGEEKSLEKVRPRKSQFGSKFQDILDTEAGKITEEDETKSKGSKGDGTQSQKTHSRVSKLNLSKLPSKKKFTSTILHDESAQMIDLNHQISSMKMSPMGKSPYTDFRTVGGRAGGKRKKFSFVEEKGSQDINQTSGSISSGVVRKVSPDKMIDLLVKEGAARKMLVLKPKDQPSVGNYFSRKTLSTFGKKNLNSKLPQFSTIESVLHLEKKDKIMLDEGKSTLPSIKGAKRSMPLSSMEEIGDGIQNTAPSTVNILSDLKPFDKSPHKGGHRRGGSISTINDQQTSPSSLQHPSRHRLKSNFEFSRYQETQESDGRFFRSAFENYDKIHVGRESQPYADARDKFERMKSQILQQTSGTSKSYFSKRAASFQTAYSPKVNKSPGVGYMMGIGKRDTLFLEKRSGLLKSLSKGEILSRKKNPEHKRLAVLQA